MTRTARAPAGSEPFRLVQPQPEHIDGLDRLLNDPAVAGSLGGPRSRDVILEGIEAERRHWREHGFGPWVALDPETGEVIGRGGIRRAEVLEYHERRGRVPREEVLSDERTIARLFRPEPRFSTAELAMKDDGTRHSIPGGAAMWGPQGSVLNQGTPPCPTSPRSR
jgi:hypothetical protein